MGFRPIHRLRLYAPRSVDANEATLLTPRAGSVHSDVFCVASKRNVVDDYLNPYKPYLGGGERGPRGRSSEIDPLEAHTDIGEHVWTILDKRTGAGNLQRWLTAYLGDAKGGNQLLGLRCEVDESLDDGDTWARFSTGRVSAVRRSSGSRVWMEISVRDLTDDLDNDIFVEPPHSAVASYAQHSQVFPIGLLRPYGDFPIASPVRATVGGIAAGGTRAFRLTVSKDQTNPPGTLATRALYDLNAYALGSTPNSSYGRATVWIAPAGTQVGQPGWVAYDFDWLPLYRSTSVEFVYARPIAGSATTPANGQSVDFYIETRVGGVSETLPILINDVHPFTLLRHLLLGYFGRLDASRNVTWQVKFNAANFAAFEADASFPPVRFRETAKAKLHDWVTDNLLRPNHVALRLNAEGELELVDMRPSAVFAPAWTLTNEDLVASTDAVDWDTDKSGAVSSVTGTFFGERYIGNLELPKPHEAIDPAIAHETTPPDIPVVRIVDGADYPVRVTNLGSRELDVGGDDHQVECRGLRFRMGAVPSDAEKLNGLPRVDALKSHLIGFASAIRGPYGLGPTFYTVEGRRESAAVAQVRVGTTGVLNLDAVPNPATGERGGSRVAFCLSRVENGPLVTFRFLDWGANSVGTVPVLGAPAPSASHPASAFTLPVTVNADNQVVRVDVAITSTATAVRPDDTSALWQAVSLVAVSETVTLARIAGAGRRVWIRGRSEPAAGRGFSLPSGWAYPAAGYIDLSALAAPTAVNVTSPSGDLAQAEWTAGGADLMAEVFIVAGAAAPTGLDSERVGATMPAGSVRADVYGLTVAGTEYTIGVRHVDDVGNVSAIASDTFTAGAIAQLAAPSDPDGFSRPLGFGFSRSCHYGLVVLATEAPAEVEFAEAVETGVGTGAYGAYTTVGRTAAVVGDWTVWSSVAPNDRRRRKLKARSVRDGATASVYSAEVVVSPWLTNAIARFPGSALSLTTPRNLWGRPFDGSDDVDGPIVGATTGDFSGPVTASNFILGPGSGGTPGDPGGPVAIEDEGVEVTPEVSRINFTGPGVTVTNAGSGEVTAHIVGAVSSVHGRTGAVIAQADDYTFAQIGSKPSTIGGYGITDFNSLGDARWSQLGHSHSFASLTSKPTTLGGYGITDAAQLLTDVTFRDVIVHRGDTTGVVYFGNQAGGNRYLYYDGSQYYLVNAALNVNQVNASIGVFGGYVATPRYYLERVSSADRGFSFYASNWATWQEYMGPAATGGQGHLGNVTPPSGSYVTSWARRSLIQTAAGYGWTWEHATEAGSGAHAPTLAMELDYLGRLSTALSVRTQEVYADNGWFRSSSASTGLFNSATEMGWWSGNVDFWDIGKASGAASTSGGIRLRTQFGSTIKGLLYWNSAGFGLLNDTGNWAVRANHGSGMGGELVGAWSATGAITAPNFILS